MNRLSAVLAITAFSVAGFAAPASAVTIVNQPPQIGNTGAFLASDFAVPRQAGDRFNLGLEVNDTNLVSARWYGIYALNGATPEPPPVSDDFTANFYAISGAIVDTSPIVSLNGADLTVQRSAVPVDSAFGFGVFEYSSTFSLGAGVVLPAGDYLFSVVNDLRGAVGVPPGTAWFWRTSLTGVASQPRAADRPGQLTDNAAWTDFTSFGGVRTAYRLTVNAIPSPSSSSMAILGLALVTTLASRRRKMTTR